MKIGIVGLGIMGLSIARNCARAGFEVSGFDTDPERAAMLRQAGGTPCATAAEVAAAADIVLTSLPSIAALDQTAAALAAVAHPGQILCELSTLPTEVKQRNHDLLAGAGIVMLDCPLSGTGSQAETGDLVVLASGDLAAFERARPAVRRFRAARPPRRRRSATA